MTSYVMYPQNERYGEKDSTTTVRVLYKYHLCLVLFKSHKSGLNRRPLDYKSSALPLSYCGRYLLFYVPTLTIHKVIVNTNIIRIIVLCYTSNGSGGTRTPKAFSAQPISSRCPHPAGSLPDYYSFI